MVAAHSLVSMPVIAGAVLAAGSGRRMGRPKGELTLDGVRLVDLAVAALRDGGCAPVITVVRDGVEVADTIVTVNPDPGRGQRSSLALAVAAAGDADALAVLLVDTPGITAAAVRAVTAAWTPGRIAIGSYGGRRAHPTVMAPALWREALALAGPNEGARALLSERADVVDVVEAPGDPVDLDTPDDVRAWEQAKRRES